MHVARAGFPVRMQHGEFVNRYGLLAVNILQDAWVEAKKEHPDTPREQERAVARCVCVCVRVFAFALVHCFSVSQINTVGAHWLAGDERRQVSAGQNE